jgi:thiol-disulfide isomerase/thioredoxin
MMLRVGWLSSAALPNWSASIRGSTPRTAEPLRLTALRDRVVLLEFWTFACVNCQRTLPFLRRMHDQYQPDLTVVGVHSPEFAFERSVHRYWPTMYLIDRAGQIRYTQIGEGNYGRTETAIRTLLAEAVGPAGETRAAS